MTLPSKKPLITQVAHHYAGVIIVTESGRLIAQLRDDNPGIDFPGKIGTFGGAVEPGETPRQAACRELQEETNIVCSYDDFTLFWESVEWRPLTNEWEGYHIFTITIPDATLTTLEIYEGQGWAEITDLKNQPVTPPILPIFTRFMAER